MRWFLLLVALALAGCGTRTGVVKPEEVPNLNDRDWTVKSAPAARPR
jgi:uncharacterized lipoprotein YmbA